MKKSQNLGRKGVENSLRGQKRIILSDLTPSRIKLKRTRPQGVLTASTASSRSEYRAL